METSKVTKTSNGKTHFSLRATIPKSVCDALGIVGGDRLNWYISNGKVIVYKQKNEIEE